METDYLIIGAGAVGMAFADTLLDESDAHITLVDRRYMPGGHWNDAYPFVHLHQPSAYYGVNSKALGSGRKETTGPNAGLHEMAAGAEVNTYFADLMRHKFLPSGRVSFLPSSNYRGDGVVQSVLSGTTSQINVRKKVVDATLFSPSIPVNHTPNFHVAQGVRMIAPNALPSLALAQMPSLLPLKFCVLGAGKTGMDAIAWLLGNGVAPASVQWVVPRDSWIQNRLHTQPGLEFFQESIGGEALKMAAFAESKTTDALFLKLEAAGLMLRIDPTQNPTMFHYATITVGEVEQLRMVTQVIRQGRVQSIDADGMDLDHGRMPMAPGTVYVDCTASAIRHDRVQAVFQGQHIHLQLLRAPLVTLSAAIAAYIEVHGGDDDQKNALCTPVPMPHSASGYALTTHLSLVNQFAWSQDKALRQWMRGSRLDCFGKMVAEVGKDDLQRQAVISNVRLNTVAALKNLPALMGEPTVSNGSPQAARR